jgi:peptide/nickel transport system permease protein
VTEMRPRLGIRSIKMPPSAATFGLIVIICYALVAVFAPVLAPHLERSIVGAPFEPWSSRHLLGTDNLGRDMLSRLIFGARNTLGIAFAATIVAFMIGTALGFAAATLQGYVDQGISRIVDVLMSIPKLIFSLMLLTIFGNSLTNLVLIIAVLDSTRVYRLARAVAYGIVTMDYVEAARLRGEGLWWIVRREILPNATPPLAAEFGMRFCFVFLTISALSFLGLGIQPPMADWGSMVRESATLINFGDYRPLLPAAAIGLLAIAVNFVIDWIQETSSGLKDQHH